MPQRGKELALCGILAALAMIFSYIEALIPLPIPIPGIKLGLANLVIVIALYSLDLKHAFAINITRILVVGIVITGIFAMLYSLAGGILSLFTMGLLKKTDKFSIVGVSMAGGVMHNVGQLIIAAIMVTDLKMFLYFPVLLAAGLITGILIGIASHILLKSLPAGLFPNTRG